VVLMVSELLKSSPSIVKLSVLFPSSQVAVEHCSLNPSQQSQGLWRFHQ
jgi:hypothetical protein